MYTRCELPRQEMRLRHDLLRLGSEPIFVAFTLTHRIPLSHPEPPRSPQRVQICPDPPFFASRQIQEARTRTSCWKAFKMVSWSQGRHLVCKQTLNFAGLIALRDSLDNLQARYIVYAKWNAQVSTIQRSFWRRAGPAEAGRCISARRAGRCAGFPLACMQRSAAHAARAGGEAVADAELCGTAEPASHARLHAALRCGTPAQSCLNADLLVQHGSRPADISPARAGAATASNPLTGSYVVTVGLAWNGISRALMD